MPKKTVIIVGDSDRVLAEISAQFEPDFQVIRTTDPKRIASLAAGKPIPGLVILDTDVPVLDCFELCKTISCRECELSIPIVFYAANDSILDEIRAFECGAVDYIVKPTDKTLLYLRLRAHISQQSELVCVAAAQERELKFQKILNGLLIALSDKSGLQKTLETLTRLTGLDYSYLVYLKDNKVIIADLYSRLPDINLKLDSAEIRGELSRAPQLKEAAGITIYGKVAYASAIYFPLVDGGHLIGFIELCSLEKPIKPNQFSVFSLFCNQLLPGFIAVYRSDQNQVSISKAKVELQKTANLYHTLLDDSNDLIISWLPDETIRDINNAGIKRLGYENSEPPGRFHLISPDLAFLLDMFKTKNSFNDIEVIYKNKQDEIQYGLASFSAEFDSRHGVVAINAIIKDMTEQIAFQQQLWQTNLALGTANEQLKANHMQMVQQEKLASIGALAAGVAHEINNPLAFVSSNHQAIEKYIAHLCSYIEFLEQNFSGDIGKLVEFKATHRVEFILRDIDSLLRESNDGYDRIIKIVKSLKNFSHLDNSGQLTELNITEAINNTLLVAANTIKYVATVQTDFGLSSTIECYGDQINQVLLNLVVNAAQAIESQHRSELGVIRISTGEENGQAVIRVCDDGPGIPDEIKNRVFEPFFTTKDVGKGTGLGLSITNDIIVNKHQGSIRIQDAEGGGACFTVCLPLVFAAISKDMQSE